MADFEFIIMRQGGDGRWMIHRRLDANRTGEDVKAIAEKLAQRYRARVTVLGGDPSSVQTLFVYDERGRQEK